MGNDRRRLSIQNGATSPYEIITQSNYPWTELQPEPKEMAPFEPQTLRTTSSYMFSRLLLAHSPARTTRTRKETKTDFLVGFIRADHFLPEATAGT